MSGKPLWHKVHPLEGSFTVCTPEWFVQGPNGLVLALEDAPYIAYAALAAWAEWQGASDVEAAVDMLARGSGCDRDRILIAMVNHCAEAGVLRTPPVLPHVEFPRAAIDKDATLARAHFNDYSRRVLGKLRAEVQAVAAGAEFGGTRPPGEPMPPVLHGERDALVLVIDPRMPRPQCPYIVRVAWEDEPHEVTHWLEQHVAPGCEVHFCGWDHEPGLTNFDRAGWAVRAATVHEVAAWHASQHGD